MAVIRLYQVLKEIKGKKILDDITLEIKEGEMLCFLGPTGCGKTTLLRVIAGLEPVDSGEIYLDDKPLQDMSSRRGPIRTVFEDYFTYRRGGPKTRIGYHLMFRKWLKRVADERVEAIAKMMGIKPATLLDKMDRKQSKGQQQKLDFARYLATKRQIFLLDDPFLSLDVETRETMWKDLEKVVKRFKVTTIYVTQELREAKIFAGRIAVMRDGRIEQVGTFEELNRVPNSEFVANFLKYSKV